MTRNRFHQQLAELNMGLSHMGQLCAEAIGDAVEALATQELKLAENAVALERIIDEKERDIQTLCLKLLMQQQPVASDLRVISSAMKMITDMERIGDQAADIAEIAIFLIEQNHFVEPYYIAEMAVTTQKMVNASIQAYIDRDEVLAGEVMKMDDTVDDMFRQVIRKLSNMIAEDPEQGEMILDLLMIAKYLERIGDHATNIAEWVVYSITAVHPDAKA